MDLTKLVGDSRIQVSLTLLVVWLLAVWHFQTLNSFSYPLFSVGLMTVLDVTYTRIRFKKWYWPSASLVTGLLIGLIIDPSEPIWIIALAVLVASLSKQFISVGIRRHIFNPAAFGILAVNLAFGTPVAWWGVAWSRLPLLILVPAMVWVLWRLKRQFIPLTFLATYFVYLLTLSPPGDSLKILIDGTVMLFALVMLPEPITSPNWGYFRYLFGFLVVVLAIVLPKFVPVSDNFLPALLVGNLVGFLGVYFFKTFLKTKASQNNKASAPNQK